MMVAYKSEDYQLLGDVLDQGPQRRISTQSTRSVGPPERPCQNSAGQVTSNPFF